MKDNDTNRPNREKPKAANSKQALLLRALALLGFGAAVGLGAQSCTATRTRRSTGPLVSVDSTVMRVMYGVRQVDFDANRPLRPLPDGNLDSAPEAAPVPAVPESALE